MKTKNIKQVAQDLLGQADIKINGKRSWDIQVKNEDFYSRVLGGGAVALGESYMDGWWESEAIDQFIDKLMRVDLDEEVKDLKGLIWNTVKAKVINRQRKSKAHKIGEWHYDIGNDLYRSMLDKRMNYSCAYWKDVKTLDQAQEAKLDLICRKLNLKPGMTVLDIGCGWGGLAKFAAEKYQVKVVGVTVSKEQAKMAKKACRGLDVEIRIQDYRDVKEKFDCIVSVGMFEHVGPKNYKTYFKVANRCLKEDGLFLLHTIGGEKPAVHLNYWVDKYIFPGAVLPSTSQITKAHEGLFNLEDWHNFGTDYDKTLMAWHDNFNKNWDKIKSHYDERFRRMWNFYLLSCAGSFRARKIHLWQIVFSKLGSQADYESIR